MRPFIWAWLPPLPILKTPGGAADAALTPGAAAAPPKLVPALCPKGDGAAEAPPKLVLALCPKGDAATAAGAPLN